MRTFEPMMKPLGPTLRNRQASHSTRRILGFVTMSWEMQTFSTEKIAA
jgi:hypothetical protein